MKTISACHLGDLHAGPGSRNVDRFRALDQAIAEASAWTDLGVWFWPGDLSHAGLGIEYRNQVAERVVRMAEVAPVIVCRGNHDPKDDLRFLALLGGTHQIYVVEDRPQTLELELATGGLMALFVLPYPTKAGLVSLGLAPADALDVASAALEILFMQAAHDLERSPADVKAMIGHVNVGGSKTSTGQPNIGKEIEIGEIHLDRLGDIYKGLNHIHKAQQIAGAWYPGSLCRLSWGEIEPKGYLRIQWTLSHDDDWSPFHVTTCPLAVPPMYHIEGRLEYRVLDGDEQQVLRTVGTFEARTDEGLVPMPSHAEIAQSEVRLRYTYKLSQKDLLDHTVATVGFAHALKFHVEPIAEPDREVRAPAVAAAKTLPDKVRAWAESTGQTAPAGLLAKLGRLEHEDPAQLLASLQAALAPAEEPAEAEARV